MPKYDVFSGPHSPVFGLNTGKYGTEKTPYLDTFHAVAETLWKDMQTNLVTDLVYGVTMGQTVFLADMSINKNDTQMDWHRCQMSLLILNKFKRISQLLLSYQKTFSLNKLNPFT